MSRTCVLNFTGWLELVGSYAIKNTFIIYFSWTNMNIVHSKMNKWSGFLFSIRSVARGKKINITYFCSSMSVIGPRSYIGCGSLKNPHCSMTRPKYVVIQRQWWRNIKEDETRLFFFISPKLIESKLCI